MRGALTGRDRGLSEAGWRTTTKAFMARGPLHGGASCRILAPPLMNADSPPPDPAVPDAPAVPDDLPLAWNDPDGTRFLVRPIAPGDFERVRTFQDELSFGTRYFRFGRGDFRYADEQLRGLCSPDPAQREHLVALAGEDGAEQPMAGSARYIVSDDGQEGEFTIVVLDRWQGHGLGRRLMRALIARARCRGLRRLHGQILGSNRRMLEFVERLGFALEPESRSQPIRRVSLSLRR
jgi:acetyltransferase